MQKISSLTSLGKSHSSLRPSNRRDHPPVQQFSDQVRLCVIAPSDAADRFDAMVDGEIVVQSSRTPFCDTARVLLDRGVDSNSWLILRHAGSRTDSLRAKAGVAAKLTVKEPDCGRAHFARYVPFLTLRWSRTRGKRLRPLSRCRPTRRRCREPRPPPVGSCRYQPSRPRHRGADAMPAL